MAYIPFRVVLQHLFGEVGQRLIASLFHQLYRRPRCAQVSVRVYALFEQNLGG
jgi:hypothetical protein